MFNVAYLYSITFTEAFTEYNVSLAASTSVGLGPNTTHVYKTAEGGMRVTVYHVKLSNKFNCFGIRIVRQVEILHFH